MGGNNRKMFLMHPLGTPISSKNFIVVCIRDCRGRNRRRGNDSIRYGKQALEPKRSKPPRLAWIYTRRKYRIHIVHRATYKLYNQRNQEKGGVSWYSIDVLTFSKNAKVCCTSSSAEMERCATMRRAFFPVVPRSSVPGNNISFTNLTYNDRNNATWRGGKNILTAKNKE